MRELGQGCRFLVCVFWLAYFGSSFSSETDSSLDDRQLGSVAFTNSGAAEAQEPFLKGLAALHSFWYDEAADLFQEARKKDPDFAMAYWGEAMTHYHPLWNQLNSTSGRTILNQLAPTPEARAAKAPTPLEKGFLAAVEILFGEDDLKARKKAYAQAMGRLAASFPDDLEAAAFHALSLMGTVRPGDRDFIRRNIQAAAICEPLYDRNPKHPGVLHYLIHAYDDPIHAPLGLPYALVYAQVAPAAHHALHMPSHIFVQLGMWDKVVASNIDAYAASVKWVQRRNHSIGKRDFHSLGWLHYGYLQQGRASKALECIQIARDAAEKAGSWRVLSALQMMMARQLEETGAYENHGFTLETLGMENTVSNAGALLALGLHAARSGDLDLAKGVESRLRNLAGEDRRGNEAAIMAHEVAALVRLKSGDTQAAQAEARRAAELELASPAPRGPVVPIKPALELRGEILLETGKPAAALEPFEESLLRTPRRPASLLGMARAHAKLGDTQAATRIYRQLAAIWKDADPGFAGLAEAKAFLAKHP